MNRRQFLRAGVAVGVIGPRSVVAVAGSDPTAAGASRASRSDGPLRLNYNESPMGVPAASRQAAGESLAEAHRYPDAIRERVREALARQHGVRVDNILLGNGSTEILQMIVQTAASPNASLVLADPTFEAIKRYQRPLPYRLESVPLDRRHGHDIGRMREIVDARSRPSVVYLCNPNNPTGTLTASSEIDAWIEAAPETVLFAVDEAYYDYVQAPGYWSAVRWIDERPNVVVVRTFSKIYGMAGLRLGYAVAHAATVRRLREFMSSDNANAVALAAAEAALEDETLIPSRRRSNAAAMQVVTEALRELGLDYLPSHANFLMHRVPGSLPRYIERMRENGILVGRPFPPLLDYNRLSLGLPEEMAAVAETWRTFRKRGWI